MLQVLNQGGLFHKCHLKGVFIATTDSTSNFKQRQ